MPDEPNQKPPDEPTPPGEPTARYSYGTYKRWMRENPTSSDVTYEQWLGAERVEEDHERNLAIVASHAAGTNNSDTAIRISEDTLHKFGYQSGAFMAAVARSKMARLVTLLNYTNVIEDRLITEFDARKLSNRELLKMYDVLNTIQTRDLSFISATRDASRNQPPVNPFNKQLDPGTANEALAERGSRERIIGLFKEAVFRAEQLIPKVIKGEEVKAQHDKTTGNAKPVKRSKP